MSGSRWPLFELHTNEGTIYVESTQDRLRKEMFRYIREKRATGMSLSDIIFCWSPVHVSKRI